MVAIVYSHPIEMCPPIISFIKIAKHLGEKVAYVGLTYTDKSAHVLRELAVNHVFISRWPLIRFRDHPLQRIWLAIRKLLGFSNDVFRITTSRRKLVWKSLKKLACNDVKNDIIVSMGVFGASLLGDEALQFRKRHVNWILELGEMTGRGLVGFNEAEFFKSATFVTSEINRSKIFHEANKTPELPMVLPNKSWGHPRNRNLQVSDSRAERVVRTWRGKTVFLYQGSLGVDRNGIMTLLEWLSEEFPHAIVAIMTGFCPPAAQEVICKHKNMVLVPHVTAPHHLEVTSHATVGVAMYVANKVEGLSDQNAIHCAPNKTFECAGFGIPMLCNDIPGLVDSVGAAGAALCVPFEREQMMAAAHELLEHYELYSANAQKFFDSVDEVAIVKKILEKARS